MALFASVFRDLFAYVVLVPKNWCKRSQLIRLLMSRKTRLKFPKKNIYTWIQQFYFGRKQKYLWKRFYTIKKPLNNRANDKSKKDAVFLLQQFGESVGRKLFLSGSCCHLTSFFSGFPAGETWIILFRLFPIISISQKIFSFFFLTLEKIGIDEKVICYHNISN